MPQLQITENDRPILRYGMRSARIVIGRDLTADLALPGSAVSRRHARIRQLQGVWWLEDLGSTHGTWLGEERLEPGETVRISVGSSFRIAGYAFLVESDEDEGATRTRMLVPADHEEVIDLETRAISVVSLVADDTRHVLKRVSSRVGGPGAHVVVGDDLPRDACRVRVVRGRPMIEPGAVPAYLVGARVRDTMPLYDGDRLQLGDHEVEVQIGTAQHPPKQLDGFGELVGSSTKMQLLYERLDRVARHDATVLLIGESGTGKELAARGLHDAGPRQDKPFVAINAAAIPEDLVASELFGHEAGAFTGARARKDGAFHRAHRGTLFLDELGEVSLDVQTKLLRVLESGEVRRVGSSEVDYPDVRVVAATNRNLPEAVARGAFRRDLLYRIAVLTVQLPPLREHPQDIPTIAHALLARHHPTATLSEDAAQALKEYAWPGNVRELRNVLTRAVVLGGERVTAATLAFDPWASPAATELEWTPEDQERLRLQEALRRHGNNRAAAARELGVARTTLLYKLKKYGLSD